MIPVSMTVEVAQPQDADQLAEMIFDSGPENLLALFGSVSDPSIPTEYLAYALRQPDGQFGYACQQVIRHQDQVIACGSHWGKDMPDTFRQSTLSSLIDFFGAVHTADILRNSQILSRHLSAPGARDLCLGHITVAQAFRRQGLATAMLKYYCQIARELDKQRLTLDVAQDNQAALDLYSSFGFKSSGTTHPDQEGTLIGLPSHAHLSYSLKV